METIKCKGYGDVCVEAVEGDFRISLDGQEFARMSFSQANSLAIYFQANGGRKIPCVLCDKGVFLRWGWTIADGKMAAHKMCLARLSGEKLEHALRAYALFD